MIKSCPTKLALVSSLLFLSTQGLPSLAQSSILVLTGSPDSVDVFIDGSRIGRTDVNGTLIKYEIVAGRRTLLLRKNGYLDMEIEQDFLPGLVSKVSVSLIVKTTNILDRKTSRFRTVFLESNISEADVFVDSLYIGRTDDRGRLLIDVPVGTRSVTVNKIGYGSAQEIVYLEPGRFTHRLSVELDPVQRAGND